MPQRVINAWWIVVGVLGLVLVVLGVAADVDLHAASRRGPRWRRRLLTATLAVLAALGATLATDRARAKDSEAEDSSAAGSGEATPGSAGREAPAAAGLADAPQWKALMKVWTEAEEVGSGKRGAYPFDRAGQKKLLGELAGAGELVTALSGKKLLTGAEAGLLTQELSRLTQGVQRKRPVEMKMATCYDPTAPLTHGYYSLQRLEGRLKLLEKLAASDVLHAPAASKVLAAVRVDIKNSEAPAYLGRLTGEKKAQAERTLAAAKAAADRIEKKLAARRWPAGTGAKLQWQIVRDAWALTKPLAESGKSTSAQRKEADQKLKDAKDAIGELARLKEVSQAEASLLQQEAASMRTEMYKNPPTDFRGTCYDMMYMPPAQASFARLQQRVALLEKLAASGKVHPDVALRVLPTVRADLAVLADPKQGGKLPGPQKAQAKKLAEAAQAAIKKIETLAAGK